MSGSPQGSPAFPRCDWATSNVRMCAYHDREWGVPSFDDRHLFEKLTLEGAQAGLSWSTILDKREGYRRAFAGFDAAEVARFDRRKCERLLKDPAIVRNRLKVESAVSNARCFLAVQQEHGDFARWLWGFVDGKPIQNRWKKLGDLPAETEISRRMSKELRRLGFRFVGPTICYALMQSIGMINDHLVGCFRYREVARMGRRHIGKTPVGRRHLGPANGRRNPES